MQRLKINFLKFYGRCVRENLEGVYYINERMKENQTAFSKQRGILLDRQTVSL